MTPFSKPPFKNSLKRFSFSDIPGYSEALVRERKAREEVFWDLETDICGFKVLPLTLERFQMLRRRGNAFITGQFPSVEDITQFFFIMSPDFCKASYSLRFRLWRFVRRCVTTFTPPNKPLLKTQMRMALWERKVAARIQDQAVAIDSIKAFIDDAFQDAPDGESDGKSYYAGWVGISGELARNGIGIEQTRQMPLGEIFQRLKEIQRNECLENGVKPTLNNPSDKILAQWQRSQTAKN